MPSRRWSRLAIALLLLWQLNAAVAVALPRGAAATQALGTAPAHCTKQHHGGAGLADPPANSPAPSVPDCCHNHAAACHCAQPPALALPTLEFREASPAGPPAWALATPSADTRVADFFRPPI